MHLLDLFEAPLGDFKLHGDFTQPGSIRPEDRGIVASTKGQAKIRRILQNAPVVIDLHIANLPYEFDQTKLGTHFNSTGFFTPEVIKDRYNIDIVPQKGAINLLYVENEGASRVPLTGWIIAHRLSHAMIMSETNRPWSDSRKRPSDAYYDYINGKLVNLARCFRVRNKISPDEKENGYPEDSDVSAIFGGRPAAHPASKLEICYAFGTTKACRDQNLSLSEEFVQEAFAQYLVTGRVTMNTIEQAMEIPLKQSHDEKLVLKDEHNREYYKSWDAPYDDHDLRAANLARTEIVRDSPIIFLKALKTFVGKGKVLVL